MKKFSIPFHSRGNFYDKEDLRIIKKLLYDSDTKAKFRVIREGFEAKLRDYFRVKHAISVSSATSGLHIALRAAGIKEKDEVITTPLTWISTSNVILLEKAIPVFGDIEKDTLNLSPESINEKITKKTKVIMPVHYSGHSCKIDEITKIAKENNIRIIWDAAHALGAEYKNNIIGSQEDFVVFSFHSQKNISTLGEGGAVLTNNKEQYELLKLYQNHGVQYTHKVKNKFDPNKPWYRDCIDIGHNYRLGEFQCAVGITQLDKLRKFNKRRRELVRIYNDLLSNVNGISTPIEKDYTKSSWTFYVIKVEKEYGINRDKLLVELNKLGIGCSVHYTPIYHFKPYKKYIKNIKDYPKTEEAYNKIMSLPLHMHLTENDVYNVCDCIKNIKLIQKT